MKKVRKPRRLSRRLKRLRFCLFLVAVALFIFLAGRSDLLIAKPAQPETAHSTSPSSPPPALTLDLLRSETRRIQWERAALARDMEAVADLVPAAYRRAVVRAAREFGIEPRLLAAQASTENAPWDPSLVGEFGEIGLLQVLPATQQEVVALGLIEHCDLADPVCNLRTGAAYLSVAIERAGGIEEGLRYYNGGPTWADVPATAEYAAQVLARTKE